MKTNELMIGDWVMHTDKPLYIAGIYGERVYDDDNNVYRIEKITPIPLTPEILEKNGFDTSNKLSIFQGIGCIVIVANRDEYKFIHIIKDNGDKSSDTKIYYEELYVHELQHALRLCGLNDYADNLKYNSL